MAKVDTRGAKRKCQNEECSTPFYDLNREEFACPNCGTTFDHKANARAQEQASRYSTRKQPRVLPITAPEGLEAKTNAGDAAIMPTIGDPADVILEAEDDEEDALADAVPLATANNDER